MGDFLEQDKVVEQEDHYQVKINLRKMTWGDNMIHARFQLLLETVNEDSENISPKEKIAALKELLDTFGALTGYLERVATVTCNGVKIPFSDVPMDYVKEVMDAIGAAQSAQQKPLKK